jgi:metalloendopeptidase OMA1, mitochondrial
MAISLSISLSLSIDIYLSLPPTLPAQLLEFVWNLPHSRAVEYEADLIGLHIMHRAGFDVSEAHHIWNRMLELENSQQADKPLSELSLFSTHPPTAERAERIQAIATDILHTVPAPETKFTMTTANA